MRSVYCKNIRRTVTGSLGRYIAILAIIALGVGFFAGIKNTKGSMLETLNQYAEDQCMYDYRILSSYGFMEDDVEIMEETSGVAAAEGSISADFFSEDADGDSIILSAHSITEKINIPNVIAGKMPTADDECLADSHFYSEDDIGKSVKVAENNDDAVKDEFTYSEYTITGIMNSPYYVMKQDRGTADIGDGTVSAYIYIPEGGFTSEYCTELFVTCDDRGFVFSGEYDDNMEEMADPIEDAANKAAEKRYQDILSDAIAKTPVLSAVSEEEAADILELEEPKVYIQTREDNIGFESFNDNSDIVNNVAKVFPIFFFLIAALVCSTTMSRMIDEERGQIGALRAIGYTKGRIMLKYMIYSGSAALIGCMLGFFAGSKYFPLAIWKAYGMMYGFAPLEFYYSRELAIVSLAVSLLCSMGTTYLACRKQLKQMPAQILRPPAPKPGKRVFLEHIGIIWSHLRFLHKVAARNIFRYKKRMIMMILGIAGCTALVIAGFGIHDSVAGIADYQYDKIETYDMSVSFSESVTAEQKEDLEKTYEDDIEGIALLQETSVSVKANDADKSCSMMITDDPDISDAVNFKTEEGNDISYPGKGKALVNDKLAKVLGVSTGDKIKVKYADTKSAELEVSGIYKNYVSNYIYINADTYEQVMDEQYEPTMAFVTACEEKDVYDVSEKLYEQDDVAGIYVHDDVRNRVDDMMQSLNYVIILVVGCAGALAFIVLFNLGNINITERVREIATIEVLGFYPNETSAYVFRENFILVIMGIIFGLPTGYALHKFIMANIVVDAVSFNEIIEPASYLFAVMTVIGFAIIVDVILRRKVRKINMAEALKSVE